MAVNMQITDDSLLELRGGIKLDSQKLSPQEGFVISRINGPTPVSEIYRVSPAERDATATLIKQLVDRGILLVSNPATTPKARTASAQAQSKDNDKDKYGGFIFDLMLMQEDVDLTVEQKKEIIYTHAKLPEKDYFELLNVKYDAPPTLVKKAFLGATKKFHPDRFFRKRLGSFERMLTDIYSRYSEAHFTLLDSGKKRAYLKKLESTGKLKNSEQLRSMEAQDKERNKRIRDALKTRRLRNNPLMSRVKQAKDYFEEGKKLATEGNFTGAMNQFQLAVSFDPHNEVYKAKVEEVQDKANSERANKILQRAQMAQTYSQEGFLDLFEEAAELGKMDHKVQFATAQAFLENEMAGKAKTYLKRCVKLSPRNIDYKMILGTLYLRTKKREEAAELFREVLSLVPDHSRAKELLKEAKKWF